jgi:hypothetical protein
MAISAMYENGGFSGLCVAFMNENGSDQMEFDSPNEYGESGDRYRFLFGTNWHSLLLLPFKVDENALV